jgi:hypothetical protein
VCFASKKPSEREFFVPAGTDLAAKLLTYGAGVLSSGASTLIVVKLKLDN